MKFRLREHAPMDVFLIALSWIVGSLMFYYGYTSILPLLINTGFTASLLFRVFIYLISAFVGIVILFYSVVCLIQV